ncbi:TPA: fimbrial protein [Yersinia enterocolitica]|nr:fimbrial protein [Yersinia enterocolitica]
MLNLKYKRLANKNITQAIGLFFITAATSYLFTPATSYAAKERCMSANRAPLIVKKHIDFERDMSSMDGITLFQGNGSAFDFMCDVQTLPRDNVFYYEAKAQGSKNSDGSYQTGIPGLAIKYAIKPESHCTQDSINPLKGSCKVPKTKTTPTRLTPIVTLQSSTNHAITGDISIHPKLTLYYHYNNEPEKLLGDIVPGQLNFTFKRYGCRLDTPNLNFNMGQIPLNQMRGTGTLINNNEVEKYIMLSCDPSTRYSLTVEGLTDPRYKSAIHLTKESGAASGIAVLLTADYRHIKFGEAKEMGTTSSSGSNLQEKIRIAAQYIQIADKVTPGSANASATFTMTYQ